MVPIPAGEFLMGSSDDEPGRASNEGPQHHVQLAPFFIGRMPITQGQWRQVALWQPAAGEPPWERELNPEPAYFNGAAEDYRRPVERVNYLDAMEFCNRLSRRTGRRYTLPSEAQWEYACRAATTTPFHCGPTLSTDLANYKGTEPYGEVLIGEYRRQTTDVGMFPANAWGLNNMHGNVLEWCADHWHQNYFGAQNNVSPWVDSEPESDSRLLRGGSWDRGSRYCRSSCRNRAPAKFANGLIGFRVVCLPQGPSLNA